MVFVFFLASCLPYIPEKGTVGASGDLAPLSHLALGLIGEGKMWSPKSGWADAKYVRLPQLIAFFLLPGSFDKLRVALRERQLLLRLITGKSLWILCTS